MSYKITHVCENCGNESTTNVGWYTLNGINRLTELSYDIVVNAEVHDFCCIDCLIAYIWSRDRTIEYVRSEVK
jgi:hypothetical protein